MKTIRIQGKKRARLGKAATRALRKAEKVPCVMYGAGEPIHFATDQLGFKGLVYTPDAHFVNVQLEDGARHEAILQDVQFHPVTDAILHADFYLLQADRPICMSIPVRLTGRSRGVTAGGSLSLYMRRLKIRAIPKEMPTAVEIDITPMRIGDRKYVTELQGVGNYKLLHPDNAVVVAVRRSRAAMSMGVEADAGGEETDSESENT
ncbi:MAG: 50S ribosomal protein L25/general stress protein Ctc [Flavobacteriales bacterium]